jgi:hypothetical protein
VRAALDLTIGGFQIEATSYDLLAQRRREGAKLKLKALLVRWRLFIGHAVSPVLVSSFQGTAGR